MMMNGKAVEIPMDGHENPTGGTVSLTNGTTIPLPWITWVGKTDADGHVISAWDVRAHGLSGNEGRTR